MTTNDTPFTDLVSAFLGELDADERIDLMCEAQSFVRANDPELHDEALAFFWRSVPGFNAFVAETACRAARTVRVAEVQA